MSVAQMLRDDKGRFLARFKDARPVFRAAETLRVLLTRRVRAQGLDEDNNPFAPYANSTAKRKGKRQPDLTATGLMLDRLTIRERGQAAVTIEPGTNRDRRILIFHVRGTRRMPRRDFFGVTPEELNTLQRQYQIAGARAIKPEDRRRRVSIRLNL